MALSTLLVAERDNDAPNTAMAETSASPTIRADAVWAVRRGLRMEFSRPSRPEVPNRRARGRPMTPGHRARHRRGQHGDTDEEHDGPESDQGDGRSRQTPGQQSHPDDGDDPAPDEPSTERDLVFDLLVADGGHGCDPDRTSGRTDGGHQRDAHAHDDAHHDRARSNERPRRKGDTEPAEQLLETDSSQDPEPEADDRGEETHHGPPRRAQTRRPDVDSPRRCAGARARGVRWPTVMEKVLRMVNPPTKSAMKAKTSSAVLRNPSA